VNQRDIERLRALEKAVELVEKATPGPWSVDEYGDVEANGEDVARIATGDDHAAADAEIVAAAVNFIREHGSSLIAELGQEVGAVTPADAVFSFSAFLTSLPHVVPFGAAAWATPGVDLA
jgi:hypothetical protein